MALQSFIGTWEITDCSPHKFEGTGLEGARFRLDENGDVTWWTSGQSDSMDSDLRCTAEGDESPMPLFSCETYEVTRSSMSAVLKFGAYAGHVIEFKTNQLGFTDTMILRCESWCVLHCQRVTPECTLGPSCIEEPYSLLTALEDGFFADVTIRSSNSKDFRVHSCVLRLNGLVCDVSTDAPSSSTIGVSGLNGLPENVLLTVLHWVYAECLPIDLQENTCHEVIKRIEPFPSLAKLSDACKLYLKNLALKNQLIELVNDMHLSVSRCVDHFSLQGNSSPAQLCLAFKQAFREAAVGGAKLLLFCDLFSRRRGSLSRSERHEIVRYAKSRLPVFLGQFNILLPVATGVLSNLSQIQRQELACYLVPEIETILSTITSFIVEVKTALEKMIEVLSPAVEKDTGWSAGIGSSLKAVLHIRELSKLRVFHQKITLALVQIVHKKESCIEMSSNNKVRSVCRNLEQLSEELPLINLRLENDAGHLEDKLNFKDFKFCFKVATSKVSSILQKLIQHKATLQDAILQVCDLVQRCTFNQSMVALGLLDMSCLAQDGSSSGFSQQSQKSEKNFKASPKYIDKLNLVESLCSPPCVGKSSLAKGAMKLFESQDLTDMEFVIVPPCGERSFPAEESEIAEGLCNGDTPGASSTVIRAHRVIVAARCDLFKKALLSGMKEAIHKKIEIHDTSPAAFNRLLNFLYGGCLDSGAPPGADSLCELLLLADRYEVNSLKKVCESALINHVDEESAICFLSMSDQINATMLKSTCLSFISLHPELIDHDLFDELPHNLQAEVYDLVMVWPGFQQDRKSVRLPYPPPPARCPPDSPCSPLSPSEPPSPLSVLSAHSSNSINELAEMMRSLDGRNSPHDSTDSLGLDAVDSDSERLEECLAQLRDVIGPAAASEQLIEIALAADYDVNRAINFYYANTR